MTLKISCSLSLESAANSRSSSQTTSSGITCIFIFILSNSEVLIDNERYGIRWKNLKLPQAYKVVAESDTMENDWKTLFVDRYSRVNEVLGNPFDHR